MTKPWKLIFFFLLLSSVAAFSRFFLTPSLHYHLKLQRNLNDPFYKQIKAKNYMLSRHFLLQLWRKFSKCTKLYRSNKIYKIRIHRECFNFYSVVTLLLRMFVKLGVHWGNWFDLQVKINNRLNIKLVINF